MTKNITVIDENGNITGSTYPKRAKGLIQKGRAQRVDDTRIQLCAPPPEMEEQQMANNLYDVFDNQLSKMQEQLRDEETEGTTPVRLQILKTLETFRIQEQKSEVVKLVREQLGIMQESMKADDKAEDGSAREVTRQKMLDLMSKLADSDQPSIIVQA